MRTFIEQVFVVAAKRTPFGKLGGKLSGISATNLAVHACRAVLREAAVVPKEVQHCVIGTLEVWYIELVKKALFTSWS